MADPRIIHIELDEATVVRRSDDVEQERRIALFDLKENSHFRPLREHPGDDYAGPWQLHLAVHDGRLAMDIRRADGTPWEQLVIALGRFRRPVREYFAIVGSYYQALRTATADQIETIDMARRAIHNDAAQLLMERLGDKIELDFDTARRLFTLICVLHFRG